MTVNHDVTGSSPVGGAIRFVENSTDFSYIGSMSIVVVKPEKGIN